MAMKRFACLVVAIVVTSALSWHQTQSAGPDDFRFDAAELKEKTLWTQVNAEPYHISTELDALCRLPTAEDYQRERERTGSFHLAPSIIVYVNNLGRESMFAKSSLRFPEGSIIVRIIRRFQQYRP